MISFSQRLPLIQPFIAVCFICGFAIALWNPHPRFILTAALRVTADILILGPYAVAALYALRIQHYLDGHQRYNAFKTKLRAFSPAESTAQNAVQQELSADPPVPASRPQPLNPALRDFFLRLFSR